MSIFQKILDNIEARRSSKSIWWSFGVYVKDFFWMFKEKIKTVYFFSNDFFVSLVMTSRNKKVYNSLKSYCMFIGYPRSGHSIIGSILDAHPNVVIAHELDALRYVELNYSIKQIFYLLLKKSEEFTQNQRVWEGYSYFVPNQWHSTFKVLQVIGDKRGGASSRSVKQNIKIISKLDRKLGKISLKIIHVYRNPYDNISTIQAKAGGKLSDAIEYYFSLAETVVRLKNNYPGIDIIDVKQEEFIENPKRIITNLCNFLGVMVPVDYLDSASSIVWKKPHRTRFDAPWTPGLIELVAKRNQEYDFLKNYKYDE